MGSKKIKPSVIKQNVGVDISKDDFKVKFYRLKTNGEKSIKGSRTFKNTLSGFNDFLKWVEKHRVVELEVRFTIEATGIYHENLVYFLDDSGYYVSVVLANQSHAYGKSLNQKTKTDNVDAQMLGQMGIERDLRKWVRTSPNLREIKQLTRDRVCLLEERTALQNKLHALNHSFEPNGGVIKRMGKRIDLVKKQIADVEKQITKVVATDEVLLPKVQKICAVKGLGTMTVVTLLAETNGFKLFKTRGQLVSYAGYDVMEKQSGSSVNGKARISKRGNRFIRRALHFPALSVIKYEQQFKDLFDRVLDRTSIKMKAYVAVQRKLLVLIYSMYKNETTYDPNYINNKEQTKKEVKIVGSTVSLPTLDACSRATSLVS